jgi:hypothetical protein
MLFYRHSVYFWSGAFSLIPTVTNPLVVAPDLHVTTVKL